MLPSIKDPRDCDICGLSLPIPHAANQKRHHSCRKASDHLYYLAHREELKPYYLKRYLERNDVEHLGRNRKRLGPTPCSECGEPLPEIRSPKMLHHAECLAAYERRHTQTHRDRKNEVRRRSNRALRDQILDYYGRQCCCCGESQDQFLTIDHIEGGGNAHRREIKRLGGNGFYAWLRQSEFPSGFQTLCFNCNWAKGHHGHCPHQATA